MALGAAAVVWDSLRQVVVAVHDADCLDVEGAMSSLGLGFANIDGAMSVFYC